MADHYSRGFAEDQNNYPMEGYRDELRSNTDYRPGNEHNTY
jgi:hypothetical protein